MSNIFNNKQAYAYSTDCKNHAKELTVHNSTKYFQAKTKLKYKDIPELHCSKSEHNFSSTCTLIILYFSYFKVVFC